MLVSCDSLVQKMSDAENLEPRRFFKGWAKPGPFAPGGGPDRAPVPDEETLDAISGDFRIFQLKQGHRFSTDDVLTAWYGTSWCPRAEVVLDLGSGVGSVGMIAAWRLPGSRLVTVEAQAESVRLAQKSARYNGLDSRYEIRLGDFREAGILRSEERFDLVLGSPPYFPLDAGVLSEHPQKVACRFESRGDIRDYCQAAARHLNWGGLFACVFPDAQRPRFESATSDSRLTIVRRRPVILKEGEPPLLSLFAMMRSDHSPSEFRDQTWVEPPLTIRTKEGKVHAEYSAVKLAIGFPP